MSTYYDIRTKATLDEVAKSDGLEVIYDDTSVIISDKKGNGLSCFVDDNNVIRRLTRYGANNPDYILYKMVADHKSLFIDEYTDKELMYEAIARSPIKENTYELDYGYAFEDFTMSFMKYWEKTYGYFGE